MMVNNPNFETHVINYTTVEFRFPGYTGWERGSPLYSTSKQTYLITARRTWKQDHRGSETCLTIFDWTWIEYVCQALGIFLHWRSLFSRFSHKLLLNSAIGFFFHLQAGYTLSQLYPWTSKQPWGRSNSTTPVMWNLAHPLNTGTRIHVILINMRVIIKEEYDHVVWLNSW